MKEDKHLYIGSLAFFVSCFFILVIIYLIHIFVPDKLDAEYILANFSIPLSEFTAEQAEKCSYIVSVLTFPLIYWGVYSFFKRRITNVSETKIKVMTGLEVCIGIILFPICILFSPWTIYVYMPKFSSFVFPVLGLIIFSFAFIFYNKSIKIKYIITTIIYLILLCYIVKFFNLYNIGDYAISTTDMNHFDSYFYPIYKTISGMTPGIDFRNLYGFYPYIYSLFFNLDSISFQNISLFVAIQIAIIFILLAFIIFSNIKNKVIAFITYNMCLYYSLMAGLQTQDKVVYYLQYLPHRVIFPILIAALITIYLKTDNDKIKKVLEPVGYILSSVSIFWNIESGIATLAGWSAMHFCLSLNCKNTYKMIINVLVKTFISCIFAFLLIFIVTYMHSGQIINPLGMFFGQFLFYGKGFFMIKMHVLKQPFVLVVLVYLICLADSIKAISENKTTSTDVIKFAFSVIGFGLFTYFQGRSHVLCLTGCSWMMYILLGILIESYYLKYLEYKNMDKTNLSVYLQKINLLKFILLFIMGSIITTSCILCVSFRPQNIINAAKIVIENSQHAENLKLLDKYDEYDFLTEYSSYYYLKLKKPNLLPFSNIVDCLLNDDFVKIYNYLDKSKNKLVIDKYTMNQIDIEYFNKNYTLEKTNGNLFVYKRNK